MPRCVERDFSRISSAAGALLVARPRGPALTAGQTAPGGRWCLSCTLVQRTVSLNSRIDVEVSGVFQSAVVASVRRTVGETLGHLAGRWQVQVSPAAERGRWTLHLRGAFGHHVASFVATPAHLAATIRRRLRFFLKSVVPPLVAVGRPALRVVWSKPSLRPAPAVAAPEAAPGTRSKDGLVSKRKMR